MTDFDRTNTGVLFKNDKQTDRSPDYSGSLNVEGVEYFFDAWIKESRSNGRKFLSARVKPKQQRQPQQPQRKPPPSRSQAYDDEPPF